MIEIKRMDELSWFERLELWVNRRLHRTRKGYKGFRKDMTCQHFQYLKDRVHLFDGTPMMCYCGMHFGTALLVCEQFYPRSESVYCEVEALGETDYSDVLPLDGPGARMFLKGCTDVLYVGRQLSDAELDALEAKEYAIMTGCAPRHTLCSVNAKRFKKKIRTKRRPVRHNH